MCCSAPNAVKIFVLPHWQRQAVWSSAARLSPWCCKFEMSHWLWRADLFYCYEPRFPNLYLTTLAILNCVCYAKHVMLAMNSLVEYFSSNGPSVIYLLFAPNNWSTYAVNVIALINLEWHSVNSLSTSSNSFYSSLRRARSSEISRNLFLLCLPLNPQLSPILSLKHFSQRRSPTFYDDIWTLWKGLMVIFLYLSCALCLNPFPGLARRVRLCNWVIFFFQLAAVSRWPLAIVWALFLSCWLAGVITAFHTMKWVRSAVAVGHYSSPGIQYVVSQWEMSARRQERNGYSARIIPVLCFSASDWFFCVIGSY